MNDENVQATEFDPKETGRIYAQELINALTIQYHTSEAFIEAQLQARHALLAVLDAVDPAQIIESARQNALPDEIQRRKISESEQRRKVRGSFQDPLYPPIRLKRWD